MTQIKAAEDRADARAQAVEDASYAAEAKVFQVKATTLVARLPRPAGFTPAKVTQTNPCVFGLGGVGVCLDTARPPRPALDAYLDSVRPLGLVLQKNECSPRPEVVSPCTGALRRFPAL